LFMVYGKPFLNGLRLVILSEDQLLSADLTELSLLGGIIDNVVGGPASRTGSPTAHSADNIFIRHIYIHGVIHFIAFFCQSLIQRLRLRNGSRKAIQNISFFAVILSQ